MRKIDDHPGPRSRNSGTAETDRIAMSAFFKIANAWRIAPIEQEVLLGTDSITCDQWREDKVVMALSVDTVERLGYILKIYASLQALLPIQEQADEWVHRPNTAPLFSGESALRHMLGGQVGDLKDVADYLTAVCSGDFS